MTAFALVLQKLGDRRTTRRGEWTECACPAHDDKRASFGVKQGEQGAVVKCQAGCTSEAIVEALGIKLTDLFDKDDRERTRAAIVARYPYRDEAGLLLYEAVRMVPKDFRQRRPDGNGWSWSLGDVRRVLYRLPELLASKDLVFVVEGEKDVETLVTMGLVATTNAGGAGKWRDEYSATLRGRRVIVLPDNDEPGRKHAQQVAASLEGVAAVRIVALPGLPPKGDVSDWVAAGGTRDHLMAILRQKPAEDIKRRVAKLQADLAELAALVGA